MAEYIDSYNYVKILYGVVQPRIWLLRNPKLDPRKRQKGPIVPLRSLLKVAGISPNVSPEMSSPRLRSLPPTIRSKVAREQDGTVKTSLKSGTPVFMSKARFQSRTKTLIPIRPVFVKKSLKDTRKTWSISETNCMILFLEWIAKKRSFV